MAFTYGTIKNCTTGDGSAGSVYQVRFGYELQSQNENLNQSTIKLQLQLRSTNSQYKPYGYSYTTTIEGTTNSGTYDLRSTNTWTTIGTRTVTVTHNSDGTYNVNKSGSFTASVTGARPKSGSANVSVSLPTIARASQVYVADANIGSSTTISVNSSSSNSKYTYSYRLNDNDQWTTIVTKTSGSYSWTVPTSFYSQIPNSKTLVCQFKAETFINDVSVGTTTTQATFTATGDPNINSASATDTNSITTALTGDNTKMVRYASNVQVSVNVSGQNSATISSVTVNGSNVSLSGTNPKTGSITFNSANTNSFVIVVTDSRGYQTSTTKTMTAVNYVPLTLNATIRRNQPTDGKVNISVSGNYFNGSFGSQSNTLTVQYRYKESGGSYGNWANITTTLSGNTYSGSIQVSNIDYTKVYYFDVRAIDKIQIKSSLNNTVTKGTPVFWWDNDEFHVNGKFETSDSSTNNTTDTWVPVWRNGYLEHRVIPTAYNSTSPTLDKIIATNGVYSRNTGEVGTPVGNSHLIIKRATNSEAPNNGVVLEFGNSTSWTGQLYIGDNATQGIWYNGWSNGVRGNWIKLTPLLTETGTGVVTRSSGATLNSSNYARFGNVVTLVVEITTTASISAGNNVFVGTINNAAFRPKIGAAGTSYNGTVGMVGYIDSSGNITIRVISATLASGKTSAVVFTYVI